MATIYRLDCYDTSGVLQKTLTDFTALSYTRRVNSPGVVQFGLRGDHPILASIADKWQIDVYRKPDGQAWAREITGLVRMDKWTNAESSKYSGFCNGLMDMLSYSVIAWYAGYANRSTFSAVEAETIMKTLITYNATTSATTGNGRKRTHTQSLFTGLSVEADGANGNVLTWNCMGDNLLETLQNLAKVGGGDFDLVKTSATTWQFRWYTGQLGTDRSATVKFALNLGNMANPEYTSNRTQEATAAIVGGQNDGSNRTFVTRTGTNYSASNDIEIFVNATDVDSTAGLNTRGDQKLSEAQAVQEFSFKVLQAPKTLYGVHYTLGDLVTAVNPFDGTEYTQKVQAVTVTLDDQGNENISVELSSPL